MDCLKPSKPSAALSGTPQLSRFVSSELPGGATVVSAPSSCASASANGRVRYALGVLDVAGNIP
jgi:hypothetical protein